MAKSPGGTATMIGGSCEPGSATFIPFVGVLDD